MKLWLDLAEAAGFGLGPGKLLTACLVISSLIGSAIFLFTSILGLALSIALLVLGVLFEIIRSIAQSRQRALDEIWPGIFDLLRSGAEAGLTTEEQIEYLAEKAPIGIRAFFSQLSKDLDSGMGLEAALAAFQSQVGSRSADFLSLVLLITTELGGRGQAGIWARASEEIRQEQQLMNQVRAKQGWVLGSAKLAVLAPWLIVFVLLSLEQNRIAFASTDGSLVLLLGLVLSLFAYFLTGVLGRLPLPTRIFYVG